MKKLDDLKKRSLMSGIVVVLVFLVIFFSNILFVRPIIALVLAALAYFAISEFVVFAKAKNINLSKSFLIGGAICEIIAFFISSQFPALNILPAFVFFLFILFLFLTIFNQIKDSFLKISLTTFGFIYIAIPLAMILPILYISNVEMQDGRMWIFYLIFVTKITDVGAYFGGKLFGKKKLAKNISPKKTVFGSVSGLVLAVLASLGFTYFAKENFFELSLIEAGILGVVLGVLAQVGDLCESLLKRDANVKDSSKLPGLGGILDMLDSLILNIVVLYFFLIG